tara:strand:+ start:3265 stop:3930 length:666 start_codon:yes stop_codon:yes gene_type:complete
MMKRFIIKSHKHQSIPEEVVNALTHAIGAGLSVAALVLMLIKAVHFGGGLRIASALIFGCALIIMYSASTIYHSFQDKNVKKICRMLDHISIYLLIAGTYTPVVLLVLNNTWGWSLFGVIWSIAILGIIFKLFFMGRFEIFSVLLYVGMGWVAVIGIGPLYHAMAHAGFVWLAIGGLCYTFGVVFYVLDGKMKYFHSIWHLFVLAGSISHFFMIYWYALPV